MNSNTLRAWLSEPRTSLTEAVDAGIRAHVESLYAAGQNFYGYALLPGENYDINSIVSAISSDDSITVPDTDSAYGYYRYGVHEWRDWHHNGFQRANGVLSELNAQFKSMHSKPPGDYAMDEFEIAYSDGLLAAILGGFELAKASGIFASSVSFLAIWICDSDHSVMTQSVQRLNSTDVTSAFMKEFP